MKLQRLLAFVEFVYGAESRQRIFDPLAADLLRECGPKPSLLLRARWWLAIAAAFFSCWPRATFGRLSWSFGIDVACRAIAFGVLAFALQWLLGVRLGAEGWPPSLLMTIPFVMVSVIWRIRLEDVPAQQQRLLIIALAAAALAAGWWSASPDWAQRAGVSLSVAWLAIASWWLGDYHVRHDVPREGPWWWVLYPAFVLIVSSAPIKTAMGIRLLDSWWPGDNLIAYIAGVLMSLSLRRRIQHQIASR